jgi:hypothetical protein
MSNDLKMVMRVVAGWIAVRSGFDPGRAVFARGVDVSLEHLQAAHHDSSEFSS